MFKYSGCGYYSMSCLECFPVEINKCFICDRPSQIAYEAGPIDNIIYLCDEDCYNICKGLFPGMVLYPINGSNQNSNLAS